MGFRSEILAFGFGLLLLLITFGDNHPIVPGITIGNLDTILGLKLWPVLDVVFPLATIAVFLLYGWSKGANLRTRHSMIIFATFLIVLALISLDDIGIGLNHLGIKFTLDLPAAYWIGISWIYPIYSAAAFFFLGRKGYQSN